MFSCIESCELNDLIPVVLSSLDTLKCYRPLPLTHIINARCVSQVEDQVKIVYDVDLCST